MQGIVVADHFRKDHRACHGVLIARVRADERAVTLLEAEQIDILARCFPFLYFFADILEPRQHVEGRHAVAGRDLPREFRSDDGLDDGAVNGQRAALLPAAEDVFRHERARLIAVQQHELPLSVAHRDAHSVRVRICAYDDVAADLVREFHSEREGVRLFGIGYAHG